MPSKQEMREQLKQLTKRNVEISELLDKIRSKKLTEESSARDKALQDEFDSNQSIISELMMGLFRSEDISE